MANPWVRDKCANADAAMRMSRLFAPPKGRVKQGRSLRLITSPYHFALEAASFLQSERNFLRSLPCSPLASASFEHSSEAAVRGFSAFFSVAAGAVVCA